MTRIDNERVIRAAHDGGATAFTVVTGHEGDAVEAFLATAPGVGRRLAARIVVELGERMARDAGAAHDGGTGRDPSHGEDRDLAAALRSLGFPSREARDLVDTVNADRTLRGASLTERLRAALKERA